MNNKLKILTKALIWLIFPFILYLMFIALPIKWIDTIYSIILYFIFWFFPIIYFWNKKIKLFVYKLIALNLVIFSIMAFVMNYNSNKLQIIEWYIFIDNININNIKIIDKAISGKDLINFKDVNDFNSKYGSDIVAFDNCIYLSSIDNKNWYIYSFKFKSEKNIRKYWNNYFIFKSINDYVINDKEMQKIQNVINKKCQN